jgi:prepilin-type N-terminal cleavage/methylation domain-containing protein
MSPRPTPSRRRRRARGFTLIEALAALALAGVVVASAISTVSTALRTQADGRHAWLAFSIAQSKMEELAAVDRLDPVVDDTVPDTLSLGELGTPADAQCDNGVDGRLTTDMRVNEFGTQTGVGKYRLCWKVTAGFPTGALKTIRVVAEYPSQGGTDSVMLQLIR